DYVVDVVLGGGGEVRLGFDLLWCPAAESITKESEGGVGEDGRWSAGGGGGCRLVSK
nr:hypothetical protein [Tanacetum cinerariifolium]